jgi:hypothetical protein
MREVITVIGVDPGAKETGIVTRRGDELLARAVIARQAGEFTAYLADVLEAVRVQFASHLGSAGRLAVEDKLAPNPHLGMTNPGPVIQAAKVHGAVLGRFDFLHPEVVRPGKHGSGPLAAYPPALRPTRGSGRGYDVLRHCRSAWDIAAAAQAAIRMRERAR